MSNNSSLEKSDPVNVTGSIKRKRVLFIDRDGTLIKEAPPTYKIDTFSKLEFYPHMFEYMRRIATECNYELVMVSNQDGLGSPDFPEETFWPVQNFVMNSLQNEGIRFSAIHFDKTYPEEHAATRKPGVGMFTEYLNNSNYDLAGSFVIGDRITDMQLAKNLGCRGLWIKNDPELGAAEIFDDAAGLKHVIALETKDWQAIYQFLKLPERKISHARNTNETRIDVELNPDGSGKADIKTGLAFFDHMLEQIARHGNIDLSIHCRGDLQIDEHHTIEDTALAVGEAMSMALADKRGMARYGFLLPMDDCLAQVAIDFGGRSWLVWEADFKREKIGEMPTEMFYHFFKSFSDAAKCNINIRAEGTNEHHKIEAIFKAFAKAMRMALKIDPDSSTLPSTKGIL